MAAKKPSARSGAGRHPPPRPPRSARGREAPLPFQDFVDVVAALDATRARFLVVGAYAMAAHGVPRATGDLDVWVDATEDNAPRVYEALIRFGAPLPALGIGLDDFAAPGAVCQIGLPPRRIDVTTIIDGVSFDEAWDGRLEGTLGPVRLAYIGRDALLRNKRAAGRAKDRADLALLRGPRRAR